MDTDQDLSSNSQMAGGDVCVSCGAPLSGHPYCAVCGQRVILDSDFSVWRLVRDWTAATFSLDSRGLVTFRRLLFQPGRLSEDYIAGQRAGTFGPFQIFVLVTLAFFLLPDSYDIFKAPSQFFFGDVPELARVKMAALDLSQGELAILYDGKVSTYSKLGLVAIVGALALVSWGLGFMRVREFGKHMVMLVHDFCFILTMFLTLLPVVYVFILLTSPGPARAVFEVLSVLIVFVYLALSQRRVLGIKLWRAGLHSGLLIAALFFTIIPYRYAISWLTLWSL